MKIAYLIPTRGNPLRASAVIEVAKSLASGKHEITFYVGADKDDIPTVDYFFQHQNKRDVVLSVEPRSPSLGAIWNRLAALAASAEVFCIMTDDGFVATPHWDEVVAQIASQVSIVVSAFNDIGSPAQVTYPIISRGWYNLAGLYTDHFPFWFDDTYLAEVWSFFAGQPVRMIPGLTVTSNKGKTKRLRDLRFWWELYSSLRSERMAKAAELRKIVGLPSFNDAELELIRRQWELADYGASLRIDELEKSMAEPGEITPEYLVAYNRAAEKMRAAA